MTHWDFTKSLDFAKFKWRAGGERFSFMRTKDRYYWERFIGLMIGVLRSWKCGGRLVAVYYCSSHLHPGRSKQIANYDCVPHFSSLIKHCRFENENLSYRNFVILAFLKFLLLYILWFRHSQDYSCVLFFRTMWFDSCWPPCWLTLTFLFIVVFKGFFDVSLRFSNHLYRIVYY